MVAAARRQRSEPMPAHAHSPTYMLLGSLAGTSDGGERLETDVVPNSKDDSGSRTTQEAQLHWHRAVRDPAKCSCLRWLAVIHLSRSHRGRNKSPTQNVRSRMRANSESLHAGPLSHCAFCENFYRTTNDRKPMQPRIHAAPCGAASTMVPLRVY